MEREIASRTDSQPLDALIVGAGLGGLYMLHRMRRNGFAAVCVERGSDVGGTWFWNRYPGARVDTNSFNYSYSFDDELQRDWAWSERYATQPEILAYIHHVADRFGLREGVVLNTKVLSARYIGARDVWQVRLSDERVLEARFLISASGVLSATNIPPFAGLEDFEGVAVHTSRWPEELDLSGKRVGIIGTGSTGVQIVPRLAEAAEHLYVFQRTPNFCITQNNGPVDADQAQDWSDNYPAYRAQARKAPGGSFPALAPLHSGVDLSEEERNKLLEEAWAQGAALHMMGVFNDVLTNAESNEYVAEFIRGKIRAAVDDPQVAELLCPYGYPFGTKRPVLEHGYYKAFNRRNVTLVDVKSDPIERMTAQGLRTTAHAYDLDVLVLATGFDAITGPLLQLGVEGSDGLPLHEKWAEGPRTFLGMTTAGFPNFFFLAGPGSPSVLGNVITSLELHVDWITDLLEHMRAEGHTRAEATTDAENAWVNQVRKAAQQTLYLETDSWYLGANIPGKPRVFLPYVGGVGNFREACERIAAEQYAGLVFSRNEGGSA